jgi:hypothetical protein
MAIDITLGDLPESLLVAFVRSTPVEVSRQRDFYVTQPVTLAS